MSYTVKHLHLLHYRNMSVKVRRIGCDHSVLDVSHIIGGLYSSPPIPRGVRGQSEQSEQSEWTVLGLYSDFFWQKIKPNTNVLVLTQSSDCPSSCRSPRQVLGQSPRTV